MRRRRVTWPAAALGAALLVAGLAPAAESAHSATLIVRGGGYGHGFGMGQWGAKGMAERGATWSSILAHYYRGARIRPHRPVAVRVQARRASRVIVTSSARYSLAAGRGRPQAVPAGAYTRISPAGRRSYRIERSSSPSGPWRRAGLVARPLLARPGASPLALASADGSLRWLRGTIAARRSGRRIDAIANMTMEDYVRGVVPREMPASWPMHALKAQAVAARTYALRVRERARAAGKPFDICGTERCQVFGGLARRHGSRGAVIRLEHPRSSAAVRATPNRVLVYRGRPILAQYASSTGGHTTHGSHPALRPVPDPGDARSPYHRWNRTISGSRIEARWPAIGRFRTASVVARDGHGPWGGRAERVRLRGSRGSTTVGANTFRRALGLRSTLFTVAPLVRFTRNLGYGMRGSDVTALQRRLRVEGFYPDDGPITRNFGPITRSSVRRYQRAHGIRATGYVGPITRRSLNR